MASEMTQEAVVRMLAGMAPDRSWCLNCDVWCHSCDHGEIAPRYNYSLYVLPGYNGEQCQVWRADTLSDLVSLARDAHMKHINKEVADPVEPPAVATSSDYAQACGDVADPVETGETASERSQRLRLEMGC